MEKLLEFVTTYPLLVAGTVAALVAVVAFELRLRLRAALELSVPQAVRLINNGAVIVDVRAADKFSSGHIVESINLQPDALAKGDNPRLKKKRPVLVVCEDGNRSHGCARTLQANGFEAAFSLAGGLNAWRQENQLLVADRS
jgi:rhodanese-related sulfurtransferase